MNYDGKLYGKIGPRTYVPLKLTSEQVDAMERELNAANAKLAAAERDAAALAATIERLSTFLPSRGQILDEASLNEGRVDPFCIASGRVREAIAAHEARVKGREKLFDCQMNVRDCIGGYEPVGEGTVYLEVKKP